jgi:L-ribulose-5-phosphate 3-epimerase
MEIGFMQGRLCDQVDGKIQAFPWRDWELEFAVAEGLGMKLMEWTLDQEGLYENPLMTETGRQRILELSNAHGVRVNSLTGDCFMQEPFFKVEGAKRKALLADLMAVLEASASIGIRFVLIPLVDNGSLVTSSQEDSLVKDLCLLREYLVKNQMKIIFESDFPWDRLAIFIKRFPPDAFGINYDIGNSAALGFDADQEISTYGSRINNVHVKDRILHGTTVPLGKGNANFHLVFSALKRIGYSGNFILQTARAKDGDHLGVISLYRDMTTFWWANCES